MKTTSDEKIEKLFAVLQEKKKEIAVAEKPKWKTHLSFSYFEDGKNLERINIQVNQNLSELINITAFLLSKKEAFEKAAKILSVNAEFSWLNFSYNDWLSDLSARVTQLQLSSKRKEIEDLEKKLDALVSPEKRREMELEAITKSLENL